MKWNGRLHGLIVAIMGAGKASSIQGNSYRARSEHRGTCDPLDSVLWYRVYRNS
ncbi:MAG: hypothetical protein EWM72_02331 [Nitrospira sp.]|nr:MAG: hypothetical protein EWM72_02331 [Nitrospira sp.]